VIKRMTTRTKVSSWSRIAESKGDPILEGC
jgi:hypothetical protein